MPTGVPPGLCFSYPTWCRNGSYEIASTQLGITEFQQYHLENNIVELETERDMVAEYLP